MRTDLDKATLVLSMLLEGMSIRACERLTGLNRETICHLIITVGDNCERFLKNTVRDVVAENIECDELWSFIGMKEKVRVTRDASESLGDCWTFIALDRSTKLILTHTVVKRDGETTRQFLSSLKESVCGRFQITTDGFGPYTNGVPMMFGNQCDFAQLVKDYQSTQTETRYSPAKIISATNTPRFGNPDPDKICTSHIERLNLTIRMHCRRFTRLTNAHSKSLAHHTAMQAILVAWYNFCRKHETLKTTPAVASALASKPWSVRELLEQAAG